MDQFLVHIVIPNLNFFYKNEEPISLCGGDKKGSNRLDLPKASFVNAMFFIVRE